MSQSELALKAPAKINPVLEVLSKRPDGFHELALIFQAVSLYDELHFSKAVEGVALTVEESPAPLAGDDSNLVVKAAKLFLKEILGSKGGVNVRLKKRIPLEAGLGGGSSDAAAVLRGLDILFETRTPNTVLAGLAAQLGSDVPFFLTGGTALGTGRGEKITPLESGPALSLVLVKPSQGLSTPAVYRSGKAAMTDGSRAQGFQEVLRSGTLAKIALGLFNGLEQAALSLMPEIAELKKGLVEAGALGALVSGSGPTVFGIAESPREAGIIASKMEGPGRSVFTAQTLPGGIERI